MDVGDEDANGDEMGSEEEEAGMEKEGSDRDSHATEPDPLTLDGDIVRHGDNGQDDYEDWVGLRGLSVRGTFNNGVVL